MKSRNTKDTKYTKEKNGAMFASEVSKIHPPSEGIAPISSITSKPDFEFYWQDEYGVFSFSERSLATVVKYIHEQKQHHAQGTLMTAMENVDEG